MNPRDTDADNLARLRQRIVDDAHAMSLEAIRVRDEHAATVDALRAELRHRDEEIAKLEAAVEGAERVLMWWQDKATDLERKAARRLAEHATHDTEGGP